jgi:hypothetical protein
MKYNQPLWRDLDLAKAAILGILLGVVIGFAWGYDTGSPDYSKQPLTYVKG